MTRWIFTLLVFTLTSISYGLDINPIREDIDKRPDKAPRKARFSIFAGDPERVQRVNEIKFEDFKASLDLPLKEYSMTSIQSEENETTLDLTFSIVNEGKKSYTLSFPDSQRYDIIILPLGGAPIVAAPTPAEDESDEDKEKREERKEKEKEKAKEEVKVDPKRRVDTSDLAKLNPLYTWSSDKMFVQSVGSNFINKKEKLVYSEKVTLDDLVAEGKIKPGTYEVVFALANYPEIYATATFTVVP
jgi:hypothetical protein